MGRAIRGAIRSALIHASLSGTIAFGCAAAAPPSTEQPFSVSNTGWLLLTFIPGPGATSLTQLGPIWFSEERCKIAKAATDAFIQRQRGNALVDGIRPANAESECVEIGVSGTSGRSHP